MHHCSICKGTYDTLISLQTNFETAPITFWRAWRTPFCLQGMNSTDLKQSACAGQLCCCFIVLLGVQFSVSASFSSQTRHQELPLLMGLHSLATVGARIPLASVQRQMARIPPRVAAVAEQHRLVALCHKVK